jgi:Fe2+ or Zn2+ uptake regulation protein
MMGDMKKKMPGSVGSAAMLRTVGLRATPQRIGILDALSAARRPVSVEELVGAVRGRLDVATVYRTMEAFCEAGLAQRIDLAQGKALFETAGAHHHHALCISCGLIRDVKACVPRGIDAKVRAVSGFARIDDHALEFFGLCKPCAKNV